MQRHQLLVLHTRAYQESSLLVDTFSLESGRNSFLAKGARRQNKQQWRAALQMGALIEASFNEKARFKSLYSVELLRSPPRYTGESFACATYLAEVTTCLIHPEEPHPDLYRVLDQTFLHLAEKSQRKKCLRLFELSIIESLGVMLDFSSDLNGDEIVYSEWYELSQNEGFIKSVRPSRQSISGKLLAEIATGSLDSDEVLEILKQLNQQILKPHLGDKPLKSRELWRQWRNHTQAN